MKAVRMHESGGADKLVYEDAPDPVIAANQVLVRVKACALNHLEVWSAMMPPGTRFPKPRIAGSDVAGVVEAMGDAVAGVDVGAKVMLQPGVSCGVCQACLSGRDNRCRTYSILGQGTWDGGFAELVKAPAANVIPMPENLSFEEAASIPLVFVTAWHMLLSRAGLQRGETVLVNAAGSGVGIAGVQIAKLWGARVIASAGSDAKLEKAKALGADEGINYTTADLARRRSASPTAAAWTWCSSTWAASLRQERAGPGPERPAGDLRRDRRPRRQPQHHALLRPRAGYPGLVHGHEGRVAPGDALLQERRAAAGGGQRLPPARPGAGRGENGQPRRLREDRGGALGKPLMVSLSNRERGWPVLRQAQDERSLAGAVFSLTSDTQRCIVMLDKRIDSCGSSVARAERPP